ncbi:hypothetical protein AFB00_30650 (plasmid) [Pseudonocardia sp. HH130630-07]|nr:hypothetical protein AFB00_30650 [Pseudonocardia sp. HH130630-07]
MIPSSTRRSSRNGRPRRPSEEGNSGARRAHWASVRTAVRGTDQASRTPVRLSGRHALVAAFDWDSLIACPEPVLAGLAAGAFTDGSPSGADAPTPEETAAFLTDYDHAREHRFSSGEQALAAAAAGWVLAYNARCVIELQARGLIEPQQSSPAAMLDRHRDTYLHLRW